jgi:hypothetical protein
MTLPAMVPAVPTLKLTLRAPPGEPPGLLRPSPMAEGEAIEPLDESSERACR